MQWARKPDLELAYHEAKIKKPSEALAVGDVILVRVKKEKNEDKDTWPVDLEQMPVAQSALMCIETETGLVTEMAILAEPLLVRTLIEEPDFFDAPVAWYGRQQMIYAANGVIRKRGFNSWTPRTVPFRALVESRRSNTRHSGGQREIALIDAPKMRIVIRADRLFDGTGGRSRQTDRKLRYIQIR